MRTAEQAEQEAEHARSLMRFGKWNINLWENLGWCWDLSSDTGYLRICPSAADGNYFTTLSTERRGVGTPLYLYIPGIYDDPNDAVIAQLEKLAQHVLSESTKLTELSQLLVDMKVDTGGSPRQAGKDMLARIFPSGIYPATLKRWAEDIKNRQEYDSVLTAFLRTLGENWESLREELNGSK